jgi:hypothetical protein
MDTLTVVLLSLIALLSVVQATLLVRLFIEGRRTVLGLEQLANQLVADLTPVARELTRASGNAEQVSEVALGQLQKLDALIGEATDAIGHATGRFYEAVVPTVSRVALLAAAWRLLKRGRSIYRRFLG